MGERGVLVPRDRGPRRRRTGTNPLQPTRPEPLRPGRRAHHLPSTRERARVRAGRRRGAPAGSPGGTLLQRERAADGLLPLPRGRPPRPGPRRSALPARVERGARGPPDDESVPDAPAARVVGAGAVVRGHGVRALAGVLRGQPRQRLGAARAAARPRGRLQWRGAGGAACHARGAGAGGGRVEFLAGAGRGHGGRTRGGESARLRGREL